MNKVMNITEALNEVAEYCSDEAYSTILMFIERLEDDIEMLNIELDSVDSQPKRRHPREEDWR